MSADMIQKGRIGSLKSRTGCKTCKIRRVKCGEEKPRCLRCASTGRQCDYATVNLSLSRGQPPRVHRGLSTVSPVHRERRAFEYYFFHAAPSLSDALDLGFWRGTVLQICGHEPAVWDAIAALSTFYEHPPSSRNHRDALTWYTRSLRKIQQQIQRGIADLTVVLVSCVLFMCIESLQGNIKAALALYHQGAQLMNGASADTRETSLLKATLAPVFVRVGTLVTIFDGVAPLPDRLPSPRTLESRFSSLPDARITLYSLVTDWKIFDCDSVVVHQQKSTTFISPDTLRRLQTRQQALEGGLLAWHRRFCGMDAVVQYNKSSSLMSEDAAAIHAGSPSGIIAILLMTYLSALILTRTALTPAETVYDAHETDFAKILAHAPAALASTAVDNGYQPPFVFDMGIGLPLFITILKCRSPTIRRQALRLLGQAPAIQGMYICHSAAGLLALVVAIEERGPSCSQEDLSVASLLERVGRVPRDGERIFALRAAPWSSAGGETCTALQYSRRECINGKMAVIDEMIVLPASSPWKKLTIL
ncbi:hypothetical protein AOCH_002257 [Aspergillus ochraceoroseus]|uniref:Zn(2)-C6 fungal-type domain-containing protein n=1 Tax=Aspergillus ochraceoroseus TaxID=138278 RepID=A0A0F8ULB1_9EURO|nr:hypothetical protein AOCH_002257 [Aspergillus ochraceoroseus]